MKGIVLAGGSGTRLAPLTRVVSKQLLPVYDKPMIYYPVSTLMLAGVRDILVISTPDDLPLFERLLGDGGEWGISFSYATQPRPEGIAQALTIGEPFAGGEPVMLILGDNIFYGHGLTERLAAARSSAASGATIFAYQVDTPARYGVVELDDAGHPRSIEEKPAHPRGRWAVTGLYVYDGDAASIARELTPSARGELEISDVNRAYLARDTLRVERLGRGFAWFDAGTIESLSDTSGFVRAIEERQRTKLNCPEEIALVNGWIDGEAIRAAARRQAGSSYGDYLLSLVED